MNMGLNLTQYFVTYFLPELTLKRSMKKRNPDLQNLKDLLPHAISAWLTSLHFDFKVMIVATGIIYSMVTQKTIDVIIIPTGPAPKL